jgi:PAS domain S-box-containing protein
MNYNSVDSQEGESKEFDYNPFFELSPDLLCIAGHDGYFKKVNPAFKKLLGYTDEELYSRPINSFIFNADHIETDVKRSEIKQNIPLVNFNNRYFKKSGELIWLSWTSVSLPEKNLIYAIAKNITHLKVAEIERNKLLAKYSKKNDNLKILNYSTTHDLKSPIANMQMIMELIDTSKIEDQETVISLELMNTVIDNLKNTLVEYQKKIEEEEDAEGGANFINFEDVINNVKVIIGSLINDSSTEIEFNFDELSEIEFNQEYLESIFLNLFTNSIKYAKPGIAPRIIIESKIIDGVKQIIFEDNGIGFDMEKVRTKVFGLHQKFSSIDDSSGIGLYLVYHHLSNFGGKIALESKLGEGSRFTITFRGD